MNWFFRALGRYGEFHGRSRRKEYWWFVIITWIVEAALIYAFLATSPDAFASRDGAIEFTSAEVSSTGWTLLIATLAVMLILVVPYWAVTVRRIHDSGKSGAWALLLLILPIVVFILALLPGDRSENKHGPDPIETNV